MKATVEDANCEWCLPAFQIERGLGLDQITDRAGSQSAGLIVLGVHAESHLARHLHTSFAYQVLYARKLPCGKGSANDFSGEGNTLMSVLEFSALLFGTSLVAGFLGALTGLGGGVVIVPVLALFFKVDIRYAIGASLVSVIATSSGAAVAYVREGLSNIRIGMFLEVATTIGACFGAYLATRVSNHWIAIVFGLVLLYSAIASFLQKAGAVPDAAKAPNALATKLELNGVYPGPQGGEPYTAQRVPLGFGIMFGAGTLSGLLGIGSGAVKVLAMDQAMKLPFKVSTTTSNFMIGVTAAASAGIYLSRGYIDPQIAMPVMLGVLGGSLFGTHFLVKAKVTTLKGLFAVIILLLGCEMIYSGITGRI